jgi:hypothetical protein
MIALAISILWFALGVIIVAAVIMVAIWGIERFGTVGFRPLFSR